MKISVLSYSFRGLLGAGMMDLYGYLESCKYRYGLQAADIWNGFLISTEDDYLRRVREALDERELELADLAVDRAHVWEPDPAAREQNHAVAVAHLRAAVPLGARFVRIDAGGRADTWSAEEFDFIVARYQDYAQWAWDHGFKMGAENHWGAEAHWNNMKRLYEAVNHPGFAISCHIGNWRGTPEEQAEADRLVAPWVGHTHFDWNVTMGPLMEKMENLRRAGYQGYYSLEHHSGQNEYTEIGIQIARVRDVLDRWRSQGKA